MNLAGTSATSPAAGGGSGGLPPTALSLARFFCRGSSGGSGSGTLRSFPLASLAPSPAPSLARFSRRRAAAAAAPPPCDLRARFTRAPEEQLPLSPFPSLGSRPPLANTQPHRPGTQRYFLAHPDSRLVVVDTWQDTCDPDSYDSPEYAANPESIMEAFLNNVGKTANHEKVTALRGDSCSAMTDLLAQGGGGSFDFICKGKNRGSGRARARAKRAGRISRCRCPLPPLL